MRRRESEVRQDLLDAGATPAMMRFLIVPREDRDGELGLWTALVQTGADPVEAARNVVKK